MTPVFVLAVCALVGPGATSALAAAPELAITAPAPGYLAQEMPVFSGTSSDSEDAVTVTVYEGATVGGPVVETLTPLSGVSEGRWSVESTKVLDDGQYTAVAEQASEAGTGVSAPVTFTVDTAGPEPSLNVPAPYTDDPSPTLEGRAGTDPGDQAAVIVRVLGGVSTITETVPVASGSWSYTPPSLPDGDYTVEVEQRDEAGNVGLSQPASFTVDTLPPAVSVDALPEYTDDQTPTISGHLETSAADDVHRVSVTIFKEGTVVRPPAEAHVSGSSWTLVPATLPEGTYTVVASQSDEAGNEGESNPVSFTVDEMAPVVTLDPPPRLINDRTPTVEGHAGAGPGDLGVVTVKLYKGSSATGTPVASGEASVSEGGWSYTPSPLASDGEYTVRASQADRAGNTGVSPTATFTLDTKAPSVSVLEPTPHQKFTVSQPTFHGKAEFLEGDSAVTVQISKENALGEGEDPQTITGIPVSHEGNWTTTSSGPHLANGNYIVVATQTDEAGNLGESRPAVKFLVESRSPLITLSAPGLVERGGVSYGGPTPTFEGIGHGGGRILLKLYKGTSAVTDHLLEAVEASESGISWSAGPKTPLRDGVYTAQAEQESNGEEEPGFSETITFTVDADAPQPTISSPLDGSVLAGTTSVQGTVGGDPGDIAEATVQVFAGAAVAGAPVETVTVPAATGGSWSAPLGTLAVGSYTVVALQRDDVGNVGTSAPVTFSLSEPAAPQPPVASFSWFPAAPHVGEPVSLVSTSTDPTSAIVGYSWSLAGNGVFVAGAQTIGTSFTTPGAHVVQLSVVDENGVSRSVAETIPVTAVPIVLMQPFPIVRIAGSDGAAGVRIKLLTVQAPIGAKVTITCSGKGKGKGCPAKTLSTVAVATKSKQPPGSALIAFRRFERLLAPGLTLEIKVSKAGEIGKYTRFVSRRGKLPTRQDSCLGLNGKPTACPST